MKKYLAILLSVALLATVCFAFSGCTDNTNDAEDTSNTATDESAASTEADTYVIGICQQQQHPALDNATQGFIDAVTEALGAENVTFLEQVAQGDSTTCTTIINDFVTKNVDLIMANATTALQAAANGTETIPVIGTSITEYGAALGIEDFNGVVGGNVSGCSDLAPLNEQAALLTELFPEAKTVGLLYCSAEPNSAYQVKAMTEYFEAAGLTCTEYPFADSNDIAAVASAAAAASDVIYIPTDNTAASCAESINSAVLPTNTPIVGGDSDGICAGCGVATITVDYYDLGLATGEMAVKVLKGEADITEMEIQYSSNYTKVYNKTLCDVYGIDTAELETAGYVSLDA